MHSTLVTAVAALGVILPLASPASAKCRLEKLVGFTLVAEKTIEAYIENGRRTDGYAGCNYGRILVFSDGTGVACAEYGYAYAYRPSAFIFVRRSEIKACIEDDLFDMNPIR